MLTTGALSSGACSLPGPGAGASATTPGTVGHRAAQPVWARALGRPTIAEGATAFGTGADGRCIVAFDVMTGHLNWTQSPASNHPSLFGVTADASTVLAAMGAAAGNGPGLDAPVIDALVAYDAATGHPRWGVTMPGDGQQMPGVLTGSVVIVAEADGSVLGLSEADGHQLWNDPAPTGCQSDSQDGVQPAASAIGVDASASGVTGLIAYACSSGGGITAVDAATGATRWSTEVPRGWDVDPQMTTTVAASPGNTVVAAALALIPPANAPSRVAPPPGPTLPTRIANVYGYSAQSDVDVLDAATGRTLWDLTGVVGSFVTVGGAGSVCVVTDAGGDCRDAGTGAPRWSLKWPGSNASATYPALDCIDESVGAQPCATSAGGLLYLALAADSAPAYPPGPGPATPSGSFLITALDMATGTTLATTPLPSFSVASDHAVSLAVPPAVLLVADGMVLASPQFEETDVVQAFATRIG